MKQRLVVNCIHAGGRCELKGIDLRGSVCARCVERVARESRPEPIWYITVAGEPPVKARPRSEWPLWARAIAWAREPLDIGVGDTFKRLADAGGIGGVYEQLWQELGSTCGCSDRRKRWNRLFPYRDA